MISNHNQRLAVFLAAIILSVTACDKATEMPANSPVDSPQQDVDAISSGDTGTGSTGGGVAEPDRPVVTERLPYAEVDDQLVYGHFAFPADMIDPLPGIIVIHERWGLDDGARAQADRIAAQGYVVLAIDLYRGKSASDIQAARPLMVDVVENPESANENIRQAYQFLVDSGQAPKIGVLGWSFGGGWALNAALLFPEDLDAAVIFYGQLTDNRDRLEPLNVPVLGLFGEKDRGVTIDTVKRFEATMESLGKDYEIEIFPNVGHGFADPGASTYDAEAAELAWTRAIEFLNRHLLADAA
jgi:carboxymethylenebutenolidase